MNLLIEILYQPFLNILVGAYWLIGHTPLGYDMGYAVVFLSIVIRLLLLPLDISAHRSEAERKALEAKMRVLTSSLVHDPIRQREEIRKLWKANPSILVAEGISFGVQLAIVLILWRLFATGLIGADLHLLYSWMPHPPTPYNLVFMNIFDLTHSNLVLNLIQSFMIFIVETAVVLTSPYPYSRDEVVRVQFVLPLVSFLVFMFLPAGKKVFIITTLCFSLVVIIIRAISEAIHRNFPKVDEEAEEFALETPPHGEGEEGHLAPAHPESAAEATGHE